MKALEAPHLFPRVHPRPRSGFVNDPNGPIFHEGFWHLFYQYRTSTSAEHPVVWAHMTSTDLARWRLERPALSPEPGSLDEDGAWSGNTVAQDGALLAFYSGFRFDRVHQSVLKAVSNDGGRSFGPPMPTSVLPDRAVATTQFRDPFVWRGDDSWRMVVSGQSAVGPVIFQYRSTQLTSWSQDLPLLLPRGTIEGRDVGEMWECPQVVELDGRTVILGSTWTSDTSMERLAAGEFGVLMSATLPKAGSGAPVFGLLDHGSNAYAACALRDGPGGPIGWCWATEGRTPAWAEEDDWSGLIGLPKSMSLRSDGTIRQRPLQALQNLREQEVAVQRAGDAANVDGLPGAVELCLGRRGGPSVPGSQTKLTIVFGPVERLVILLDGTTGRIEIDRTSASTDPRAHTTSGGVVPRGLHGSDELVVFIDGSILELFAPSGDVATTRFYPSAPPPWRIEAQGLGEKDELRVWALGAAFDC